MEGPARRGGAKRRSADGKRGEGSGEVANRLYILLLFGVV